MWFIPAAAPRLSGHHIICLLRLWESIGAFKKPIMQSKAAPAPFHTETVELRSHSGASAPREMREAVSPLRVWGDSFWAWHRLGVHIPPPRSVCPSQSGWGRYAELSVHLYWSDFGWDSPYVKFEESKPTKPKYIPWCLPFGLVVRTPLCTVDTGFRVGEGRHFSAQRLEKDHRDKKPVT